MFEGVDLLDAVEPLSIPSYAIDRQGIIRWLNPAARALAGHVVGRHFTDVVAPTYRSRVRDRTEVPPKLTPRQTEVLHLLAAGASTSQIQETLHLTRETVRNHVRHILRALGAHSRLEAVALARRSGVID